MCPAKKFTREMVDAVTALGLLTCLVCGSEALTANRKPTLLLVGGLASGSGDPPNDPGANVIYGFTVQCSVCGHILLFDLENHRGPDEPVPIRGGHPDPENDA